MRVVCPNCDAQYEVDDAAIPEGGRDVQCSNCGHAWYQMPPGAEAEMAAAAEDAVLFGQSGDNRPAAEGSPPPVLPPAPVPDAGVPAADRAPDGGTGSPEPPATAAAPPRRRIDEAVLSVLREEAEREAAARRADAARALESQPELGLSDPARPAAAVPSRAAAPAPSGPAAGENAAARPPAARSGPRRDLLPDIEEINSTLRAGSEARDGPGETEAPPQAARRSGFRAGFSVMLVLLAGLAALYALAPRIAQHVPGSAGAMEAYVAAVDELRLRLDGALKGAVAGLRGLSGQDG